jgi:hypothetical protein
MSSEMLAAKLRAAVELALRGDWQGAHLVAQDHEGDSLADWLHGIAHRMEGDLGNARYWYRRCGRALREDVTVQAELAELKAAIDRTHS